MSKKKQNTNRVKCACGNKVGVTLVKYLSKSFMDEDYFTNGNFKYKVKCDCCELETPEQASSKEAMDLFEKIVREIKAQGKAS